MKKMASCPVMFSTTVSCPVGLQTPAGHSWRCQTCSHVSESSSWVLFHWTFNLQWIVQEHNCSIKPGNFVSCFGNEHYQHSPSWKFCSIILGIITDGNDVHLSHQCNTPVCLCMYICACKHTRLLTSLGLLGQLCPAFTYQNAYCFIIIHFLPHSLNTIGAELVWVLKILRLVLFCLF